MGGCHCWFRNCKVSTYTAPDMHFFHFPLKDKTRCELWVKYSKLTRLYDEPVARQKNMVLCARHFRDEFFMNYKKDRLVATAVPTITRLSMEKALDYELELENGVLITLPEPPKHVVPPPGFKCFLGFASDRHASTMLRELEQQNASESQAKPMNDKHIHIISVYNVGPSSMAIPSRSAENVTGNGAGLKRMIDQADNHEEELADSRSQKRRKKILNSICSMPVEISENSAAYNQSTERSPMLQELLYIQPTSGFTEDDDADIEFIELPSQTATREAEAASEIDENDSHDTELYSEEVCHTERLESSTEGIVDGIEEIQTIEVVDNATAIHHMSSHDEDLLLLEVSSLKSKIEELEAANAELRDKYLENMTLNEQLQKKNLEQLQTEHILSISRKNNKQLKNENAALQSQLNEMQLERDSLTNAAGVIQDHNEIVECMKERHQAELAKLESKHKATEQALQQKISTLESIMEMLTKGMFDIRNSLNEATDDVEGCSLHETDAATLQIEISAKLQNMLQQRDCEKEQQKDMQDKYEGLQEKMTELQAAYELLKRKRNQESTVSTSDGKETASAKPATKPSAAAATAALTKAQLFNGIKRYISASMCSLLRMEMFGGSEREWKPDERQVAVDLLRLGESVYKYFTDEWRFHMPALRDVRKWLNEAVRVDDEEDL